MICVFKTSVKTREQGEYLSSHLNKLLKDASWNFDFEDSDKILRVDSLIELSTEIIALLNKHGFDCEELLD